MGMIYFYIRFQLEAKPLLGDSGFNILWAKIFFKILSFNHNLYSVLLLVLVSGAQRRGRGSCAGSIGKASFGAQLLGLGPRGLFLGGSLTRNTVHVNRPTP